MSKLHPFWWLNPVVTCDTVKACLEGDYTAWTEIAGSPITFTYARQISQAVISEAGNFGVLLDNYSNYSALFNIDPPAVISEAANTDIGASAAASLYGSLLGKYIVVCYSSDVTNVYVYKNGVLIQTITSASTPYSGGVWISPSGKYVFVMNRNTKELHIYKGA